MSTLTFQSSVRLAEFQKAPIHVFVRLSKYPSSAHYKIFLQTKVPIPVCFEEKAFLGRNFHANYSFGQVGKFGHVCLLGNLVKSETPKITRYWFECELDRAVASYVLHLVNTVLSIRKRIADKYVLFVLDNKRRTRGTTDTQQNTALASSISDSFEVQLPN